MTWYAAGVLFRWQELQQKTKQRLEYLLKRYLKGRNSFHSRCGVAAVSLSGILWFSGDVQIMWFCASASTGRYLQQEPLVADDCSCVPVDDLGERQLPAVTQHHRHTCSLRERHTHTETEGSLDMIFHKQNHRSGYMTALLNTDPDYYSVSFHINSLYYNWSVCICSWPCVHT